MTEPISGLTGIKGFVYADPEATAEERQGGTADPRHDVLGESATPYPWEAFPGSTHGPYGLENELLGMDAEYYTLTAGMLYEDPTADLTPVTNASPWPKGVPGQVDPDGTEYWREQNAEIHGINVGGRGSLEAVEIPTADPVQDNWVERWEVDAGASNLQDIPGQLKTSGSGGWGSTDRQQSYAHQNEYGFGSFHLHRRYAASPIPGNFMWMVPGSRPLVKSVPGTAIIPVGADSPFSGQDVGESYDAQGAALYVLPASYVAPPDPAQATGFPSSQPDASWDLW